MLVFLIVTVTIILLLFLFSMVWPVDSPWSPWWRTNKKTARIMCELAKINDKDIIYDMGSGDGTALCIAAREYGATGVGIEVDLSRFWFSKILARFFGVSDKLRFKRKNFFDVDLSEATVVFAYLIPKTLSRLKIKFLKELKPGTRVVTFVYKIDLPMIASDEESEVYVYEIPKI